VPVVIIAASITLYMVLHLPTGKERRPGHAGNPGMEEKMYVPGVLGRFTIKKLTPAVKANWARWRK
jgi:hypothetical protein